MGEIQGEVKAFLMREFLSGENPDELTEATPLITGGILDSIAMLKLVAFLEERFQIEMQAHEVDVDHLNTLAEISKLIESKVRDAK